MSKMYKKRLSLPAVFAVLLIFMFIVTVSSFPGAADEGKTVGASVFVEIERTVRQLMQKGKIPGLSLVVVREGEPVYRKGFGYAGLENQVPVTPETLFEIASCSKAFTALAALKLEQEGLLRLDEPFSTYLPWFYARYNDREYQVTLRQALHHTTGIRTGSLSLIPPGTGRDALEQTVRNLVGFPLEHVPGTHYEYATINYDIVGAVIEKVSGMTFEEYMAQHIFRPLGLTHSTVGVDRENPPEGMAVGYKIGYSTPHKFEPPVYRGNNPAGYVISNAVDMGRWLQLHMGLLETDEVPGFRSLVQASHRPDLSVRPESNNMMSYGMGWFIDQYEGGGIFHAGLNPNFSAYVKLSPTRGMAVAVMANSNSQATEFIGDAVLALLQGRDVPLDVVFSDSIDKASSVISYILGIFLLLMFIFLVSVFVGIIRGRRGFEPLTWRKTVKLFVVPILSTPFLYGIYLLPGTIADASWETAMVWSPISFQWAVLLLLICLGASYIGFLLSILFPQENKYLKSAPMLVVLSMLTGGANAVVIFLITSSLYSNVDLVYLLYYFGLAMTLYIMGRKLVQTRLIKITYDIVYDLRMKLVKKIFYTSFQKFEKLDRGRILATLNDDTGQIGGTASVFVGLVTSLITVIGAFIYLSTIAFWATMLTTLVVAVIATLYYIVSRRTDRYFEEARDTQNVYMGLLDGLIDGFKELSLHLKKKNEYRDDIEHSSDLFREKSCVARIRYLHAFLIGESLLIVVLGSVSFAVPRLFPDISNITLMSFIMVLLYLIGPINSILNAIPGIMQLKVAWNRVKEFMEDIPANMDPSELVPLEGSKEQVDRISVKGLTFRYKEENEDEVDDDPEDVDSFGIGPIDFEANKGDVVFIVGGNGSGKTTLAKVITGLYKPDKGSIKINGNDIPLHQLGEYFSTVFGDYHLFGKIYEVDLKKKGIAAHKYLRLLRLEEKVEFVENAFSTIDLSGGQRKRLALLQCYLEDCPIFLFDELAADQDPVFRRFFYRELLPRMKEAGKIVIGITHDDHYFDAADKVIKLDMGKIEVIEEGYKFKYKMSQ